MSSGILAVLSEERIEGPHLSIFLAITDLADSKMAITPPLPLVSEPVRARLGRGVAKTRSGFLLTDGHSSERILSFSRSEVGRVGAGMREALRQLIADMFDRGSRPALLFFMHEDAGRPLEVIFHAPETIMLDALDEHLVQSPLGKPFEVVPPRERTSGPWVEIVESAEELHALWPNGIPDPLRAVLREVSVLSDGPECTIRFDLLNSPVRRYIPRERPHDQLQVTFKLLGVRSFELVGIPEKEAGILRLHKTEDGVHLSFQSGSYSLSGVFYVVEVDGLRRYSPDPF